MLADGKCEITGESGILDLEAGGRCACVSPLMGIDCQGRTKMNCPHCGFHFKYLFANAAIIPDMAPILCEDCMGVSLCVDGRIRKPTEQEFEALKTSPAWKDVIEPALRFLRMDRKSRNAINN